MPNPLPFTKMHGLGNDYVVVNADRHPIADAPGLAKAACNRRFGIGADGLLLVSGAEGGADFRMRMFNVDGSEAEMCGNGLRCAARYAREEGLIGGSGDVVAATGAGPLRIRFGESPDDITVDMGAARVGTAQTLEIDGDVFEYVPVSIGNPHAVIYVDDVDDAPVTTLGPRIETHERFPDRTNVEFVEITSTGSVRQRTWERGCGETLACGTGACAVAAASVATGRTGAELEIRLTGGALRLSVTGDEVRMRGPAERVFEGTWLDAERSHGV